MAERPHFTYFTTKWGGMRFLLPQVHIQTWWHYTLLLFFVLAASLGQQALEAAFLGHEDEARQEALSTALASGGKVQWSRQAMRGSLYGARLLVSCVNILVLLTLDVGLVAMSLAGSILGFFLIRRRVLPESEVNRKVVPKEFNV